VLKLWRGKSVEPDAYLTLLPSRIHLACLLFGSEFFGRWFVGGFVFRFRFASGFLAMRFLGTVFFPTFPFASRFFARVFGTPIPIALRLVAGHLNSAQGAPEIFDLPFIADLLFFRRFNQLQNVFHLFEGFFEGFHYSAHFIRSPGQRRRSMLLSAWFKVRPLTDWRSMSGFWLGFWLRLGPFNGRGFHPRLIMRMFLRRRRRFNGGRRRSGTWRRGGMGRTQAASTTATATTSATWWTFPWSGLIHFRLMFIRHFQNKVGVPAAKSNKETPGKCK
jgi:hypothetical protein